MSLKELFIPIVTVVVMLKSLLSLLVTNPNIFYSLYWGHQCYFQKNVTKTRQRFYCNFQYLLSTNLGVRCFPTSKIEFLWISIYRIPCENCDPVYIGETMSGSTYSPTQKLRINSSKNEKTALCQPSVNFSYNFNFNS